MVFWLTGAFAPFILECILDIFWNVKIFETKIHTYLHVLRVYKVVS
jgi:hypothetical protein